MHVSENRARLYSQEHRQLVISINLNVMSVLYYATEYLKVKQIVVCGH